MHLSQWLESKENTGCVITPVPFSGTTPWSIPDRTAYVDSADCKDSVGICRGVV